jgi:hypothetical protein
LKQKLLYFLTLLSTASEERVIENLIAKDPYIAEGYLDNLLLPFKQEAGNPEMSMSFINQCWPIIPHLFIYLFIGMDTGI